tara:strand:+ start:50 stop:775 length:726 start_codon:yes stop_codon:yes gene_type:complete
MHILVIILIILTIFFSASLLIYFCLHKKQISYYRGKTINLLNKKKTRMKGTKENPVFIVNNFLDDTICDSLIKEFSENNKTKKSAIVSNSENQDILETYRTSKTGVLDKHEHKKIDNYIINFMQLENSLTEKTQIQHYDVDDYFKEHTDYFDPDLEKSAIQENGQRTWTFMIYLNDVEKGGETEFNNLGFKIIPRKGMAVIWCNLDKFGKEERMMLHEGKPVLNGHKWIITKWFNYKPDKI